MTPTSVCLSPAGARRSRGSWLASIFGQLLDHAVEVRLEVPVLHDPVFFELGFGEGLCDLGGDFAGMVEQVALVELEKGIELLGPVGLVIGMPRSAWSSA